MDIDVNIYTGNFSADPSSVTSPPKCTPTRSSTYPPFLSSFPRMRPSSPDSRNSTRESVNKIGSIKKFPKEQESQVQLPLRIEDFPFSKLLLLKIILLLNMIPVVPLPVMPSQKILISSSLREKNEEVN